MQYGTLIQNGEGRRYKDPKRDQRTTYSHQPPISRGEFVCGSNSTFESLPCENSPARKELQGGVRISAEMGMHEFLRRKHRKMPGAVSQFRIIPHTPPPPPHEESLARVLIRMPRLPISTCWSVRQRQRVHQYDGRGGEPEGRGQTGEGAEDERLRGDSTLQFGAGSKRTELYRHVRFSRNQNPGPKR